MVLAKTFDPDSYEPANVRLQEGAENYPSDVERSLPEEYGDESIMRKLEKRSTINDANSEASDISYTSAEGTSKESSHTGSANIQSALGGLAWSIDILSLSHQNMMRMVRKILELSNLPEKFDVPRRKWQTFITRVESSYLNNPFHNFYHAVATMDTSASILISTQCTRMLTDLDILGILIGALCHDIDHPGHSQHYEVNSGSELALRHNDTAVLESHHAHMTSKILRQDEYNIFCNLTTEQFRYCRKVILKSSQVRAPASSGHSMTKIEEETDTTGIDAERASQDDPFDVENETDRFELAEAIVHCADLSGQTCPFKSAKKWGAKVFEEFRNEAAMHERNGLTPPLFMKQAQSELDEYKMQPGFINKIVLPAWEQLHELLGGLSEPLDNLKNNRKAYEEEAKKLESIQELNAESRRSHA